MRSTRIRSVTSSSRPNSSAYPGVTSGRVASSRPAERALLEPEDLREHPLEEHCVARLVHELRGQEELLLGQGCDVDERRERDGDRLLALEELGQRPAEAHLPVGLEREPTLAVAGEVEGRRRPGLLLPTPVEVGVARSPLERPVEIVDELVDVGHASSLRP